MTSNRHESRATCVTSPSGTFPGWWRRLTRKIQEVGIRYTARLVIHALIPAPLFRFNRMVILEILPHRVTVPAAADEWIRWAEPEESRALAVLGHEVEILERRFIGGARACILAEGAEVLAYVWFHRTYHDEDDLGVRFTLNDEEIWLFDAMVKADQRGRGLYPRLLRGATHTLGGEGVRRILIAIETANRNSLRAHRAAGAELVGIVWSLRFFGFTLVRNGQGLQVTWTGRAGHVRLATSRIA